MELDNIFNRLIAGVCSWDTWGSSEYEVLLTFCCFDG